MCHATRTGVTRVSYPRKKPFWLMTADEKPVGHPFESHEKAESVAKQFAKIWQGQYVGDVSVSESAVFNLLNKQNE